jgi:predicted RNA-binding Zn-ribbon protein involved in translation (DUF1610 family)
MKARDGDDTVVDSKNFGRKGRGLGSGAKTAAAGHCPKCSAEVPAKPGFRFSALKCPKCGAAMVKK